LYFSLLSSFPLPPTSIEVKVLTKLSTGFTVGDAESAYRRRSKDDVEGVKYGISLIEPTGLRGMNVRVYEGVKCNGFKG